MSRINQLSTIYQGVHITYFNFLPDKSGIQIPTVIPNRFCLVNVPVRLSSSKAIPNSPSSCQWRKPSWGRHARRPCASLRHRHSQTFRARRDKWSPWQRGGSQSRGESRPPASLQPSAMRVPENNFFLIRHGHKTKSGNQINKNLWTKFCLPKPNNWMSPRFGELGHTRGSGIWVWPSVCVIVLGGGVH